MTGQLSGAVLAAPALDDAPARVSTTGADWSPWWDVGTDRGLVRALGSVRAHGWGSTAGAAVLAALPAQLSGAARRRARRTGRTVRGEDLADLVSRAFEVLVTDADRVVAASRAWAYVVRAAANAAAVDDIAADRGVPRWLAHEGGRTPMPPAPARVGATPTDLEVLDGAGLPSPCDRARSGLHHEEDFGPVMAGVLGVLVGAGAPRAVTVAALLRCSQLAVTTGATLRHRAARHDADLAELGLSREQAGALMSLVGGEQHDPAPRACLLGVVAAAVEAGRPVVLPAAVRRRVAAFVAGFRAAGAAGGAAR